MTESPKLLPCPFCGGKARLKPMLNMTELRVDHESACLMYGKRCAVNHPCETMPVNAFAAWNRRAPDPERDAMERVCEAAKEAANEEHAHRAVGWSARNDLRVALTDLERARRKMS